MKKGFLFIIIFSWQLILYSQDKSSAILDSMKIRLEKINSYSVDVSIKVDVDFIKIKERKAKVTFTRPDKYEVKAKGFTLLPKKGMERDYIKVLNEGYTSIFIENEVVNSFETSLIKVLPDNMDGDLILAEMWIDPEKYVMHRMRTYSKKAGTYTLDFYYTDHPYMLPDRIEVSFEIKNNKLPVSITGDFEALGEIENKEGSSKGKVIIQYSNYILNVSSM